MRRFARIRRDGNPEDGLFAPPEDGMCLSAFLLLTRPGRPREVLLGRVDPAGPWKEVAALGPERLRGIGERWILPACQLLFFEDPDTAAQRIALEQLGRADLLLSGPRIFSEAYSRGPASPDPHWDLHFVYTGSWTGAPPLASRGTLWRDLRFVDVGTVRPDAFGRGHADILRLAGPAPGSPGPG